MKDHSVVITVQNLTKTVLIEAHTCFKISILFKYNTRTFAIASHTAQACRVLHQTAWTVLAACQANCDTDLKLSCLGTGLHNNNNNNCNLLQNMQLMYNKAAVTVCPISNQYSSSTFRTQKKFLQVSKYTISQCFFIKTSTIQFCQ